MQTLNLSGQWELFYCCDSASPTDVERLLVAEGNYISANVPGNVELDMMAAGVLPDLSHGNNIYLLREYENYHWWYRKNFDVLEKSNEENIELCFDGIDTISDIWLNGKCIGHCENMFIAHRFDVTDELHTGENELVVHIFPAVLEGRKFQPQPAEFALDHCWESLQIRKSPHMYGWDIFPRIVTAGIWRKVYLRTKSPVGIEYTACSTVKVDTEKSTATVLFDYDIRNETPKHLDGYSLAIRLERNGEIRHSASHSLFGLHLRKTAEIQNAEFWWPAGSGEAALYDVITELISSDGTIIDTHQTKIGLRTVELKRTDLLDDNDDGEFVFLINGQRISVHGTNWVPLDALPSRADQHRDAAMKMLTDLNCNMVRCWGGGYYEDHDFYDYCDANGIMVWQDFMMACACYPQDEPFRKKIEDEATSIVQKLRNHPSIVLWAGNNENDNAYEWASYDLNPNEVDRISRETLPMIVRRLAPTTPYLPSSPYCSDTFYRAGKKPSMLPEVHLWADRNDFKSEYYKNTPAKFISEIGYHGCPSRSTLERMFDPDYLWPWQGNEQWRTRAVRPLPKQTHFDYRIPLMDKNIRTWFGSTIDNLDDFILASQFCQAEALKFFIEQSRAGKFTKTGILWWNLRDGWPIISDAVVDYYNTPKLAYNHIKNSQANLCAMILEPENGRHKVIVVNDAFESASAELKVYDADSQEILYEGNFHVESNSTVEIGKLHPPLDHHLWLLEWTTDRNHSSQNHYITGPKPYDFNTIKKWWKTYLPRPHTL